MTPRQRGRRGLTSTDIISQLYPEGITVSREWLAGLACALFEDKVERVGGKRTYSQEQAQAMLAGAKLARRLGVPLEDIAALARSTDAGAADEIEALLQDLGNCVAKIRNARRIAAA
jgi:hypothetical protein